MNVHISIIVAMAENRAIGVDNKLPWHLPQDLKHFKALTMGHPLVMGRLTYESIGRPLPGRKTIVLTRDSRWVGHESLIVAHELDDAVELAQREAKLMGVDEIMIVGGAKIYAQLIDRASNLYVTEVHTAVVGDAFFPEISRDIWTESNRQYFAPETPESLAYSFVEYEKKGDD